jgi:hypothetical protein
MAAKPLRRSSRGDCLMCASNARAKAPAGTPVIIIEDMSDTLSAAASLRASVRGSSSGIFDDAALEAPTLQIPPRPLTQPRFVIPSGALLSGLTPGGSAEYISSYLTIGEYMDPVMRARGLSAPTGFWVNHLVGQHGRDEMLEALARLSAALDAKREDSLRDILRAWALPDVRHAIDSLPLGAGPRAVITRQGILLAAREVIEANANGSVRPDMPPVPAAFLLAQAVLDSFEKLTAPTGQDLYPTMDAALAHETVMNLLFNASDDPASQLERALRLWSSFPPRPRAQLRRPPEELLVEAAGLDIATIAEFGVCLWAMLHVLPEMQSPFLPMWDDLPFEADIRAKMLALVAATPDDLANRLSRGGYGPWGFLAFEETPVILLEDRPPLVLDQVFLWRRLSSSLFYDVLDHERKNGGREGSRAWTAAYGDMVEQMADDLLIRLSIPFIGGGAAYWDGDTLKTSFGRPRHRTADGALAFGESAVVAEIVSSGMTLESRTAGDFVALLSDLDKQLWRKVEQLESTIDDLRTEGDRLSNWPTQAVRVFLPLLIEGREFARMPVTHAYIESEVARRGLFSPAGTMPLAVIDISELEMLLAIKESKGHSLPILLREWISGPRRGWPLGNHLMETYGDLAAQLRPAHSMAGIEAIFAAIRERAKPH